MLMSKERLVRSRELSLRVNFSSGARGKGNCLKDPPKSLDFDFRWFSLWLVRSVLEPHKTEVKAGCGVHENTRQYRKVREANVNIQLRF